MKRVLVTGANGQLGQSIRSLTKASPFFNFIFTDRAELDITDRDSVLTFFNKHNPDYCINCAAYTQVDLAEKEPEKCFLINVIGVENLVAACSEVNCVLIHISTDFVFDGRKRSPYIIEDKPKPINVYGQSKYKSEQIIQESGIKNFIVRTSWLYSEFGNNFMKTILKIALDRPEIEVVDDQIGAPTYAGDLARFLLFICTSEVWKSGIYHFTNSGKATWFEFAREILRKSDSRCKVNPTSSEDYGALAKRPMYSLLIDERIPLEFERSWRVSLEVCLKRLRKKSVR